MDRLIDPLILYLACGVGGVGVALCLPRRGYSLRVFGGVLAAVAAGAVVLMLTLSAVRAGDEGAPGEGPPNLYFYVFGALALASALRMITHPRPVYSALYFILTIIATCGLFVILSAEFMAFALVIIYAGAILITYLFVIMLATQAPAEGDEDLQADYDVEAREPWVASVVGFALLAVLTTLVFSGAPELAPPAGPRGEATLAELTGKAERLLRREGTIDDGTHVASVDPQARTIEVADPDGAGARVLLADEWPEGLVATNVETLGINLLRDHPMTIEIAGVILLMAMLGATVLARKQVDIEEELKATEARRLHDARTLRLEGES